MWPAEFFLTAGGADRKTKKHILKRPSASAEQNGADDERAVRLTTIFTMCPECQTGSLHAHETRPGVLIGFHKHRKFEIVAQRCNRKACRAMVLYHYLASSGKRTNLAKMSDLTDGVLMVRPGVAFDLEYVRYHAGLHFRAFVSARSVAWVHEETFGEVPSPDSFRRDLLLAILLFRTMSELGPLGLERSIHVVSRSSRQRVDVDADAIEVFKKNLHNEVFLGKHPNNVTEISIDGNEKVALKGCAMVRKRSGRPSTRSDKNCRENGWLMAVDPRTQRVLGVRPMDVPENNAMVKDLLSNILPACPMANCVVYDRMCRVDKALKADGGFKQVKFFCTDRFHGRGHHHSCPCSPQHNTRIDRRLRGVNTSASERVFSSDTQFFLVLVYCKLHNQVLDQARHDNHLPPLSVVMKRPSRPYPCRSANEQES